MLIELRTSLLSAAPLSSILISRVDESEQRTFHNFTRNVTLSYNLAYYDRSSTNSKLLLLFAALIKINEKRTPWQIYSLEN